MIPIPIMRERGESVIKIPPPFNRERDEREITIALPLLAPVVGLWSRRVPDLVAGRPSHSRGGKCAGARDR